MVHKKNVSYVTVNAKIMPARGKRACSLFPERSLSYAKITQGECNSKAGKRSFTGLDTAKPKLILCKSTQYLMQKYTINLLLPLFLIIFEELFTQCCRTVIFM